jgi:hypothetical protein
LLFAVSYLLGPGRIRVISSSPPLSPPPHPPLLRQAFPSPFGTSSPSFGCPRPTVLTHCCYTAVRMLLLHRCCYTAVVTLLLNCCSIVQSLQPTHSQDPPAGVCH